MLKENKMQICNVILLSHKKTAMTLGIKNHLKNQPIEQSCNAKHTAFEAVEKGSIPWFWAVGGFLFPKSPGEHSSLERSSSCFLFALSTVTIQGLTPEDWRWLRYRSTCSLLIGLVTTGMPRAPSLAHQVSAFGPALHEPPPQLRSLWSPFL